MEQIYIYIYTHMEQNNFFKFNSTKIKRKLGFICREPQIILQRAAVWPPWLYIYIYTTDIYLYMIIMFIIDKDLSFFFFLYVCLVFEKNVPVFGWHLMFAYRIWIESALCLFVHCFTYVHVVFYFICYFSLELSFIFQ